MAWLPTDLANLRQWPIGDAGVYRPGLVDSRSVLEPQENAGDFRRPRGARCYNFDGVDDEVQYPLITSGLSTTLSIRWYVQDNAGHGLFGDAASTNAMRRLSSSTMDVKVDGATLSFAADATRFIWHITTIVISGTSVRLFHDGSESTTGPLVIPGVNPFIHDRLGFGNFLRWIGYTSDFRHYGRALTDNEVGFIQTGTGDDPGRPDLFALYCNEENGTTSFDPTGGANHGTIVGATLPTFHHVDVDGGVTANPANEVGFTDNGGVIVPRNEAIPAEDVQGNPLQYSGRTPYPASIAQPVGTFDGVDDAVTIPVFSEPEWTVWAFCRLTTDFSNRSVFGSVTPTNFVKFNSATLIQVFTGGLNQNFTVPAITLGEWVTVAVTRDASNLRLYVNGVESSTGPAAISGPNSTWDVLYKRDGTLQPFLGEAQQSRIYDRALTQPEISGLHAQTQTIDDAVRVYTFSEGDGTTIYDVSGNAQHGTLTGATLPTFWANRSDAGQDWCILHGGRMESTVFVPGLLDDSAAANGSPITLAKGHHGNPGSRLIYDPWTAPELSTLNLPAESPPGELLRLVAPNNTKFRSEENPTEGADGSVFVDGSNRIFNTDDTLTGTDLQNALTWIQRLEVISYIPGVHRNANQLLNSLMTMKST